MNGRVVVVGVGNPFRRDDGVGPAVAQALRERAPAVVAIHDGPCEAAELIDAWSGAAVCVVVDAVVTGAAPGTRHRLDLDGRALDTLRVPTHSTHTFALGDAVALGRALDRLPRRLVVVGVEAADLGDGPGLSPEVRRAIPEVVDTVLGEIRDEREAVS